MGRVTRKGGANINLVVSIGCICDREYVSPVGCEALVALLKMLSVDACQKVERLLVSMLAAVHRYRVPAVPRFGDRERRWEAGKAGGVTLVQLESSSCADRNICKLAIST